jgi:hypothetical protein
MKQTLLILCLIFSNHLFCTHILGGQLSYEYLSSTAKGDIYRINYTANREERSGTAKFQEPIPIGIYANNNFLYKTKHLPIYQEFYSSKCNNIKTENIIYSDTTFLPKNSNFTILYQGCCRPISENLLTDPNGDPNQGITNYITINSNYKNTSALISIKNFIYNKTNILNNIQYSYFDANGDSVDISVDYPYLGSELGSKDTTLPILPSFKTLDYKPGYSKNLPLGTSSTFALFPNQNRLEIFCNKEGNFIVGLKVSEYRNNQLISSFNKDITIFNYLANDTTFSMNIFGWGENKPQPLSVLDVTICENQNIKKYLQRSDFNRDNFKTIDSFYNRDQLVDNNINTLGVSYYYRLKTTINNKILYSDTAKIQFWSLGNNNITSQKNIIIYPNPSSTSLNITSFTNDIIAYEIYDNTGRVFKKSEVLDPENNLSIDISYLVNGLYFIKLIKTDDSKICNIFLKTD